MGDSSSGGKLSVWVTLRLLAAWAASDDAVVDEVADRVHHLPVTVALQPPTLHGWPARNGQKIPYQEADHLMAPPRR
ncbi:MULTISPECIES: hypothetical protein [Streptomyces]|uniref:hypothetical protein n=1 Tax=Streptomyces TaxID=1883 RepID=UPI001300A832|nr:MULTISPECIES: hypothetical protein [Streptomyces]MCW8122718.1 hypothetical protein [Streptomyces anthocyanicus]MDX3404494.1 hypothetical protein [Streptomyces sp. ME01-18h]